MDLSTYIGLVSPGLLFVGVSVIVLALVSPTMACSSMSLLPCRNSACRVGDGPSSSVAERDIPPSGDNLRAFCSGDNLRAFLFSRKCLCA